MERLLKLTADFTQGPYLILNQRPIECTRNFTWTRGPVGHLLCHHWERTFIPLRGHAQTFITFSWSGAPVSFPPILVGGLHEPIHLLRPVLLATRETPGSQPQTAHFGVVVKNQHSKEHSQEKKGRSSESSTLCLAFWCVHLLTGYNILKATRTRL